MKLAMPVSLTRACVVGALAPYNHGLPLAGATLMEQLAIRLSPQAGKSLVISRRARERT
jgi:hypothetical protein